MSRAGGITLPGVAAIGVALLMLGALATPFLAEGNYARPWKACVSNLKDQGAAFALYQSGCDDRMPPRDSWMDSVSRYGLHDRMWHCPELASNDGVAYGYAFNSSLSLSDAKSLEEPASMPLAFDSISLARNASDPFLSIPKIADERRNVLLAGLYVHRWKPTDRPGRLP